MKLLKAKITETSRRKWKRRLLVALTKEEIQRCKTKIKQYQNIKVKHLK